jgi:CRP-like cAMP-binding protein
MTTEQVISIFSKFTPDAAFFAEDLKKLIKKRTLKTGDLILRSGEVCKAVSVIVKGTSRNFFYDGEKEITTWFDFEGEFIGSMYSFLTKSPSVEGVELVENATIYELDIVDYEYLVVNNKYFKKFSENLILFFVKNLEQRGRVLQSCTAQVRYERFLAQHPKALKKIPSKYIASFLGITPETLSRIKTNTY